MTEKLDFRVQRTYKMLSDSLQDMLKEMDFDKITVTELCERAMIRKATFYKHFGDKYELYVFVIQELQTRFKEENALIYNDKRPQTFYIAMIDRTFQFVDQHSALFRSVMNSNSSKVLLDILSEEIESDLLIHLKEDEKAGAILPAKPELLASMITGALVYSLKWWILHDKKMPRQELVDACIQITRNIS